MMVLIYRLVFKGVSCQVGGGGVGLVPEPGQRDTGSRLVEVV